MNFKVQMENIASKVALKQLVDSLTDGAQVILIIDEPTDDQYRWAQYGNPSFEHVNHMIDVLKHHLLGKHAL